MNILKRELKAGLKPFIYWTLGLFVFVFAGVVKYTGINAAQGVDLQEMMNAFPKIVLAVMGISNVDLTTFAGYYALLSFYNIIIGCIYAIYLGSNTISREVFDKTYEFIFTKPRKRTYVLSMKLLSCYIYYLIFSILNYIFSVVAIASINIKDNINTEIILYSIVIFLLGSIFIGLSILLSAIIKKAEKGSLYGNLIFLVVYILGIFYDMFDNINFIQIIIPLKYFNPNDLINNSLDPVFVVVSIVLSILFIGIALFTFEKKDLNAVF